VAGSVADTPVPSFDGRRVLAFESRRATEIEALIRSFGGAPIVAPAIREVPLESNAERLPSRTASSGTSSTRSSSSPAPAHGRWRRSRRGRGRWSGFSQRSGAPA